MLILILVIFLLMLKSYFYAVLHSHTAIFYIGLSLTLLLGGGHASSIPKAYIFFIVLAFWSVLLSLPSSSLSLAHFN